MANSFKTRLAQIDEQILDVQYIYQRELDREAEFEPERRHLLASRGFKYRLDKLYAQRAALRKNMCNAPTKAMNYAMEFSNRKSALENAREHLADASKKYEAKLQQIVVLGLAIDSELELKCLRREIGAMRSLVSAKERAMNNWIDKASRSENVQLQQFATGYVPDSAEIQHGERRTPNVLALAPAMRIEDMSGDMQEIARASAACTAANVTDAAHSTPPDTYSASFASLNAEPAREDVSSGLRMAVESEDTK